MIDSKYKNPGLAGTAIFHAAVVAFLLIFGFTTPYPLPDEEGVLINFGTDASGRGAIETARSAAPPTPPTPPPPAPAQPAPKADQEAMTQDFEEAAAMQEQKRREDEQRRKAEEQAREEQRRREEQEAQARAEEERRRQEEQARIEEQQRKIAQSTRNAFGQAESQSRSDGTGNGLGNQGSPQGSTTSQSYTGGGAGGKQGISFSLAGRSAKGGTLPLPQYPSREEGIVIVKVKVDQNGNVTEATWESRGSTTTNKQLINAAIQAAQKAKFNQDRNADLIQVGTITYHFNIK